MYVVNFLVLPTLFTGFSFLQILGAFLIMHAITSLFLTFTFFISHHVKEVNYVRADEHTLTIPTSWAEHQIRTTIDFHPNSEIAHFLFGGFNTHIAHHLFPETCHIHYPALNEIIKETLNENGVGHWYKSFTFFEGVRSHLSHLKKTSREIEGIQLVEGSW
jgi:linoleoyl-CoA desaturase